MTDIEFYVDPSCPWAWITAQWVREVAPHRDLTVTWRSHCLEIRDDYGAQPHVPEERREIVIAAHAVSHRMLRIFEAARARAGEDAVDALYRAWGPLAHRPHSFARFAPSLRSGELGRAQLRGKAPPPRAENLFSPASRKGACGAECGRRMCAAAGRSQRRRRSLRMAALEEGLSA